MLNIILIITGIIISVAFIFVIYKESKDDSIQELKDNFGSAKINTQLKNELEAFASSYKLTISNLDSFLGDYSKLVFKYLRKAKKTIVVYNYPIDKKEASLNSNTESNVSIMKYYYRNYFNFLEKMISKHNLTYKRIFLAPGSNYSEMDKLLYKEYSNHINKLLSQNNNNYEFFVTNDDFINYNFLIIDNKYLLIELYKQTKDGLIIPDHLFVYEKKTNTENDIVTIHSNILLEKKLKPIKSKSYKKLITSSEMKRQKKINLLRDEIMKKKTIIHQREILIESIDKLRDESKKIASNIEKKKEEVENLNSVIVALNSELNFIKNELSELKEEHKYLTS